MKDATCRAAFKSIAGGHGSHHSLENNNSCRGGRAAAPGEEEIELGITIIQVASTAAAALKRRKERRSREK